METLGILEGNLGGNKISFRNSKGTMKVQQPLTNEDYRDSYVPARDALGDAHTIIDNSLIEKEYLLDIIQEKLNILKDIREDSYWVGYQDAMLEIVKLIKSDEWDDDFVDIELLKIRDIFRTKEEAEKELKKRKAIRRVKVYIEENFGCFKPNWNDPYLHKWNIGFNWLSKNLEVSWTESYQKYSPYGYLRTEENAEQLIKNMEKELLLIYKG